MYLQVSGMMQGLSEYRVQGRQLMSPDDLRIPRDISTQPSELKHYCSRDVCSFLFWFTDSFLFIPGALGEIFITLVIIGSL